MDEMMMDEMMMDEMMMMDHDFDCEDYKMKYADKMHKIGNRSSPICNHEIWRMRF